MYHLHACKLSAFRKKESHRLDEEIQSHLNDLMLPNARFVTSFTDSEPSLYGDDHVEFLISMNQGEPSDAGLENYFYTFTRNFNSHLR